MDDGKSAHRIRNGHYKDAQFEFTVQEIGEVRPRGDIIAVSVVVAFRTIPKGWKVLRADGTWMSPKQSDNVPLVMPFSPPPLET